MAIRTTTILLFSSMLLSFSGIAQGLQVLITEEKRGKRIVLMAENKTQDTLTVFFMVNAEGYRKSASKPVIKNLPPLSKTPMLTLVELNGVSSRYTYDLIINKEERNLNFTHEKQAVDIEKLIEGRLVLFATNKCEKCDALAARLRDDRIQHRVLDVTEDAILYNQFMRLIERQLTEETKIHFPIIWNKDHVIFGYDDLEIILKELL